MEALSTYIPYDINSAKGGFSGLWNDIHSYTKHLHKRIKNKDVTNEIDYIQITFDTLSKSKKAYLESFSDDTVWDRVFYNEGTNWAVVIGENGKILTSYKLELSLEDTFNKHAVKYGSKITKYGVGDDFARQTKSIADKLRKL